jgi:hypothetical protein
MMCSCVMTNTVRALVQPGTWCLHLVSSASASVIGGAIMVRLCASLDYASPGGPRRRTLQSERLYHVQRHRLFGGADHRP